MDFHALRHTFITRLARSGVAPAVAKSLARHSTITLTMDHYTHTLIGDERAALDRLPSMIPAPPGREAARATGTYDVTAKDPEERVAPALARKDPGSPTIAIAGQHRAEHETVRNSKQRPHLATPANNRHQWSKCSWKRNCLSWGARPSRLCD